MSIAHGNCIKTGCQVHIRNYDVYGYGDAFVCAQFNGVKVYLFRLVAESTKPTFRDVIHFSLGQTSQWFDRRNHEATSTLICGPEDFYDFGYAGLHVTTYAKMLNDGTLAQERMAESDLGQ